MTVSEAQNGFARLLQWVEDGEEVEIVDHEQAVAKVVPLRKRTTLAGSILEEQDVISPTGAHWESAS
jgi:prevent-host-death family protein